MDDSSDDGAAVLAHTTPGRRHSWASVHTPIDWSSAASLRAELPRRREESNFVQCAAALEDGVEAVQNSSSDEESCCDLTQATAEGGDRTPPPPIESSDEDLVDLTLSRVRARDAPTPARDGASSSSDDDDDDGNHEADARVAIAQRIKASPAHEPILLRKKVDVNTIALAGADPKTVKASFRRGRSFARSVTHAFQRAVTATRVEVITVCLFCSSG